MFDKFLGTGGGAAVVRKEAYAELVGKETCGVVRAGDIDGDCACN